MPPNSRDGFTIAIICALALEAEAVEAHFDEVYDRLGRHYGKSEGDRNSYLNGRIGKHEIVLCYMPGAGKGSAAMVASDLRFSYTNIKLVLVVGICGGVPSWPNGEPVYLGDVIIGNCVIPYDIGKQYPDTFRRNLDVRHIIAKPPHELGTFLIGLSVHKARLEFQDKLASYLQKAQQVNSKWNRPASDDCLFESSYPHKHHIKPCPIKCVCSPGDLYDQICEDAISRDCVSVGCDENRISRRRHSTETSNAAIHIGNIASGDTVMKSGLHRDNLANAEKVIGFEMEGAGVCDNFPCIIIKGIGDYADSHKDNKWQSYAAANGAAAAKTFLEYWSPVVASENEVYWMVPFKKNGKFVGRQNEITQLKDWVSDPDGPRELAISGLGGVGKTQVALELAFQIRKEDPHCSIFWIPCTSLESVEYAYTDIARRLKLPGKEDAKKEVKNYLSQSAFMRWLVIFDNADNEDMWTKGDNALQTFIPENEYGHTLFTSRNHRLVIDLTDSRVIKIPEYDVQTGIEYLRLSLLQKDLLTDPDIAILLLEKLVFLPLAITQAVAYINKNQISLSTYVELLGMQEMELIEVLSEDFQDKWRYKDVQNPVATTWWISFQQVQQMNPLAAEYLLFMACINPRDILQSILPRARSENEQIKSIGLLKSYAFVSESGSAECKLLTLHRLVYIATRNWMRTKGVFDTQLLKTWEQLGLSFPDYCCISMQMKISRNYVPHVLSILKEDCLGRRLIKNATLIGTVCECLLIDFRTEEAENLCTQMLQEIDALQSDDEGIWRAVYTLTTIHKLRGLSQVGGKLAGEFLEREKNNSSQNFVSMQYRAFSYLNFQRNKEAERLISAVAETLGQRNLATALFHVCIAQIYSSLKRYKESESYYLKGIKTAIDLLGPDHRYVLYYQEGLAMLYYNSGQYKDAERLYLSVVEKCEARYEPQCCQMLNHQFNLALIQGRQKEHRKAEEKMLEVIKIKQQMRASHFYDITDKMLSVAELYYEWGKHQQARNTLMQLVEHLEGCSTSWAETVAIIARMTAFGKVLDNKENIEAFEKELREKEAQLHEIEAQLHEIEAQLDGNKALLPENEARIHKIKAQLHENEAHLEKLAEALHE